MKNWALRDLAIMIGIGSLYFYLQHHLYRAMPIYLDEYTPLMNVWRKLHPEYFCYSIEDLGVSRTGLVGQDSTFPYNILLLYWSRFFGPDLASLRLFSNVFGALTLCVVYFIGKSLYSRIAGLLSAGFLTMNVAYMEWTNLARPESLYFFLGMTALLVILTGFPISLSKRYAISALLVGLAIFFHTRALLFLFACVVAIFAAFPISHIKSSRFGIFLGIVSLFLLLTLNLYGDRIAFFLIQSKGYMPSTIRPGGMETLFFNALSVFSSNYHSLRWRPLTGELHYLFATLLMTTSCAALIPFFREKGAKLFLTVLSAQVITSLALFNSPELWIRLIPWMALGVGANYFYWKESVLKILGGSMAEIFYSVILLVVFFVTCHKLQYLNFSPIVLLILSSMMIWWIFPHRRGFGIAVIIVGCIIIGWGENFLSFISKPAMSLSAAIALISAGLLLAGGPQLLIGRERKFKNCFSPGICGLLLLMVYTRLSFGLILDYKPPRNSPNSPETISPSEFSSLKNLKVAGLDHVWLFTKENRFFGFLSLVDPVFGTLHNLDVLMKALAAYRPDRIILSEDWIAQNLASSKRFRNWIRYNLDASVTKVEKASLKETDYEIYFITWPENDRTLPPR